MQIPQDYIKKFKVFIPETLFPPNWKALEINHCPLCGCLLRVSRNKRLMRCVAKKCVGFKITPNTYKKIIKSREYEKVNY